MLITLQHCPPGAPWPRGWIFVIWGVYILRCAPRYETVPIILDIPAIGQYVRTLHSTSLFVAIVFDRAAGRERSDK
jgi:hypothetical protein